MKMYVYSLFMIFAISTVLGDTNKTNNTKKEIDMTHIKIEDAKLIKYGKDSIFTLNICNKYSENCYMYERFIPTLDTNAIWTFMVFQNGKKISYKGMRKKIKMMKFPEGYVAIKPNECLPISVKLNNFFDFDQDKEITITYLMSLKCPSLSKDKGEINFTTTLLAE